MIRWIRDAVLISLITLSSIEIALRAAPSVIPLRLLIRFVPAVRAEIGERRNLPTERRTIEVRRDDGGPPLRVFPPHQRVSRAFSDRRAVRDVVTDEEGFCNVPLESDGRRKAAFVAVGDSFTWCTAVRPRESWVSQLAQITGIGGYNLGLGGVGPYEYVQILAAYGLRLHPRVVLLNYYEGNDLRDALIYRHYLDTGRRDEEVQPPGVFATAIAGHSYALNLALASSIEIYLAAERAWRSEERINFRYQLRFGGARVAFNLENTDADEVEQARALREGRSSLAVLDDGLRRFVELARQHRFEPVVLYTPSAYTAYADVVQFEDRDLGELMPWFSRTQRDFLESQSHVLGYRFVDLTPALRRAAGERAEKELLYFPTNLHLSQSGNEVIAMELADVLGIARSSGAVAHAPHRGSLGRAP